ncbi:MAG: rhodanese-like domain-containing protein [Ignavibacteriaceae bacterium]|nr:rhodanese-like domain-containing protein [Ignavibacteriaceae bacterium]
MGIFINYFNPAGIPLIREKLELKWASDSLFNEITRDSASTIIDTIKLNSIKPPDSNQLTRVDGKTVEKKIDEKTIEKNERETENKNKTEDVVFTEPKAIKLDQAYALFKKGITFVDARDEGDYLAGHIKNSINIPFDDFDNHKQKLDQLSKEKPLVIYCAGTECDLSILLGNLLFEMGYKKIYVFFGGWVDWSKAKYQVENFSE